MLSSTVPCRHVALKDPGKSIGCINPVPSPMTLAFAPGLMGSALSTSHAPILLWGNQISGLYYGSHSLRPADLLASLVGADQRFPPANRDFYFRASGGLVTRSAAGYDYGGNWASSTGGIFTHWNVD